MGTVSDKLSYLSETKSAIKNSIIQKGIDITDNDTFRSYSDKILEIKSEKVPSEKYVTFYNYDGTEVSKVRVKDLPLSALPEAPANENLTFQSWNWSLEDINSTSNSIDVGAIYKTTDNKTHIFYTINTVTGGSPILNIKNEDKSVVTIEWGDGQTSTTTDEFVSETPANALANGNYEMKIACSGKISFLSSSYDYIIFGSDIYNSCITKINMGSHVSKICNHALINCINMEKLSINLEATFSGIRKFSNCKSLKCIVTNDNLTKIGNEDFKNCENISRICLAKGIVTIGDNSFSNCTSINSFHIPSSVTTIGRNAFQSCNSLEYIENIELNSSITTINISCFQDCYKINKFVFPSSLKTISSSSFSGCTKVLEYDFSNSTTVVSNPGKDSTFSGINNLAVIKVPASLFDDWVSNSDWSPLKDHIVSV